MSITLDEYREGMLDEARKQTTALERIADVLEFYEVPPTEPPVEEPDEPKTAVIETIVDKAPVRCVKKYNEAGVAVFKVYEDENGKRKLTYSGEKYTVFYPAVKGDGGNHAWKLVANPDWYILKRHAELIGG